MKRTALPRSTPLRRRTPLRAHARARTGPNGPGGVLIEGPTRRRFKRAALDQGRCQNPRCRNPHGPWDPHHVIYKQHVRNHGGDLWDPANAMRLCCDCHQTYHRMLNLPASILPPAAVAFAHELLGESADQYIARYYPKES